MTSTDVADAFTSTKETLEKAGIKDDFFRDLVTSRLLVERVGESNNQNWWESRVLSETGRTRLSEVTPKTQLEAQINLALKVGRKAEADQLPADSISLFSFGPQIESRVSTAIEGIESDESVMLEGLEDLSTQSLDEGWTDGIIDETASNITSSSDSLQISGIGDSFLIAESGYTQDEIDPEKWRLLTTLLRGYGYSTDKLQVPYYSLESELKSENA
ncbi:BrxE family protein [Halalkalicoccus salilacus]|uniref:BrxE family protein n=1 Tax=Halalkalicoccus salilacus TaxID=3117459 RepID=UPI00300EE656